MNLLGRPTTVEAALKPFQKALADLQNVVAVKQKALAAADTAIEDSEASRARVVESANASHEGVVSAQTAIKAAAEAEVNQANTVIGKLGNLLDVSDDK